MQGYTEPFYEAVPAEERGIKPGHVLADHPVYMPPRHGLAVDRVNPEDDRELNLTLGGRTAEIFNHPPINSLGLRSEEGMVIAKTKRRRPVIVLGGMYGSDPDAALDRAPPLDCAMCVPVYGGDQYSDGMRGRIRAYEFRNLFYLPAAPDLNFDEGFARFDHVQPIHQGSFAVHRGLRLSGDALEALTEWFIYFMTGEIAEDSLLLEYRRDALLTLGAG